MRVGVARVKSILIPQETICFWLVSFKRWHRVGCIKLTGTIVSPYIVPSTTWGSLRPLNVILVPLEVVWVVEARKSIWSWLINLFGLCFDSKNSQYKSSQLSIQQSGAIEKLQVNMLWITVSKSHFIFVPSNTYLLVPSSWDVKISCWKARGLEFKPCSHEVERGLGCRYAK